MTDAWNPARYERFADERSRPFFDLLALVRRRTGMRVCDLGCGTGELTRALHRELAAEETLGIDSSDAMLARSAEHAGGGLSFTRADIETFEPPWPCDLVFSNAALHWCDDHESLLARIAAFLAPEGQLAVQVPANHDHASHAVAAELAMEEPFRSALDGWVRRSPVLAPEEYALLLDRLGFGEQHVSLRVYAHRLSSRDDVVEWVRGTTLTAYEERMPAELYADFLERYRKRLLAKLEDARPYFFPFKRILFRGERVRSV